MGSVGSAGGHPLRVLRCQEVEPPEVVVDRRDLELGEFRLVRVPAYGVLPHHGAGPGRILPDHPDRQTMQDTEPVVEALHVSSLECESVGGSFVCNEYATALR